MGTHRTSNHLILNISDGIRDGIPISIGYFPIGMAFGIMAKSAGLTLLETLSLSFIVFAGACQFIAVSMIALGSSGYEIILTTLFVNFRHFLMSSSLVPKIHVNNRLSRPLIAFFVTDETFSVASFAKGQLTEKYMLPMELIAYLGWGIGSLAGFLLGSILPPLVQQSMNIGLYAMFIALLAPEVKKSTIALLLAILAALLNTFLRYVLIIPEGWSIVISILVVAGFGTFSLNPDISTPANEVSK